MLTIGARLINHVTCMAIQTLIGHWCSRCPSNLNEFNIMNIKSEASIYFGYYTCWISVNFLIWRVPLCNLGTSSSKWRSTYHIHLLSLLLQFKCQLNSYENCTGFTWVRKTNLIKAMNRSSATIICIWFLENKIKSYAFVACVSWMSCMHHIESMSTLHTTL